MIDTSAEATSRALGAFMEQAVFAMAQHMKHRQKRAKSWVARAYDAELCDPDPLRTPFDERVMDHQRGDTFDIGTLPIDPA